MGRFPILNIYRAILQIIAVLIIVLGFFAALEASKEVVDSRYNSSKQEYEDVTDFHPVDFMQNFAVVSFIALLFLVFAELIKLSLFMEDHLYHVRYPNAPKEAITLTNGWDLTRQVVSNTADFLKNRTPLGDVYNDRFGKKEVSKKEETPATEKPLE